MNRSFLNWLIVSVAVSFLMTACGGGGSSSGGSNLTYSGLTTQALITEDNAVELSTSALGVGSTGTSLTSLSASADSVEVPVEEGISVEPGSVLTFVSIMKKVEAAVVEADSLSGASSAVVSDSETITGSCGGSLTMTMSMDDQTGDLSGTMLFNEYCETGETLNGELFFSGQSDLGSDMLLSFNMDFDNFSIESTEKSYRMHGSLGISVDERTLRITQNFTVYDGFIGTTYKVEGLVVNLEQSNDYFYLEMSGRYYHPDYGYVVLSTPQTIEISVYGGVPRAGRLLLTGQDTTFARLIILDSINCEVEVDLDGDGSFEASSGTLAWSEL